MACDDRELLERIQKGDGESFGVLFDRTHRWLLQFVIVPRVGRADAEDVLAETFRTALASIHGFEWRGVALLHWLSAIARRKAQEFVRGAQRAPEPLDGLPALLDFPDDVPTAEAEMIRKETLRQTRDRVTATLSRIPTRYAQALTLRLLEGKSRQGCAEVLGVSVATFDVVLYRAARAFEKAWREHD